MTTRRRRTWDRRVIPSYGFDSHYQDFTLTYTEAEESTLEGTMFKVVLNGFMAGYPVCCVLDYARRWLRFLKTGDPRESMMRKEGLTDTFQPFSMCLLDEHEWLYQPLSDQPLNTAEALSGVEEL